MATAETDEIQLGDGCGECGARFESSADLIDDGNPPCPVCGSTRVIHPIADEYDRPGRLEAFGLRYRSDQTYKGRSGNKRHIYEDEVQLRRSHDGVHRSRRTRWRRTQDFTRGWYEECVTDEATGEIHYDKREWIAFHRDRGTAKRQTFWTAYDWAVDSIAPAERPKCS